MNGARLYPWRATLALVLGLLLAAMAGATMRERLLPGEADVAVTLIWLVSVLVLAVGIVWSLTELLGLAREYRWLAAARRRAFIDHLLRGDPLPDTLVVERGRRIARLRREEAAVPADLRTTLRAEAQAASGSIGNGPRFLASLLLLLAVLGTFAGMKAALPRLTAAIRPDAAEVDPASIQQALAAIAGAFGANFLALLGAVVLAILAFGLGAERRRLLALLDHLSERHLYPLLPAGSDVSALQRAVHDMRLSVNAVEMVGDGVRDLQSTIRSLEQTLVDAIGNLQSSFSASLQRQAVEIQNQLSASVTRVALGVMNVSEVLGQTASAYQALLEGLTARDERIAHATDALDRIAASLPADLKHVASSAVEAAERASAAQNGLAAASERLERLHDHLAAQARDAARFDGASRAAVDELRARLENGTSDTLREIAALHASVRTAAEAARDSDRRLQEMLGTDIQQRAETVKRMTAAFGAAGRELQRLSASITSASERQDPRVGEIAASLRSATELLNAMREDITVLAGLLHRGLRERPGEALPRARPAGWLGPDTPPEGAS